MLTVPWGQFDPMVKNVTIHIRLFQEFHDCHHLAPLPNLIHLHLFHCRNLILYWTGVAFIPTQTIFNIVLMFTIDVTSKHARTSLHDNPRRLATMLCSTHHRTSQKKKIVYITPKVLWGPFVHRRK
jgi:hypothetical protein